MSPLASPWSMLLASTLAAVSGPLPAKLAPDTAQEMSAAVVAVNKALGLQSWPMHGVPPCVDRGGEGNLTKHVSGAETRRCAEPALGAGFPGLGGSYVVAILMTEIGPVTVVALGKDDAAGWGAHSCDPGQSCPPTKITRGSRWGKRISDRQQRACAASDTVWLPAGARICPP